MPVSTLRDRLGYAFSAPSLLTQALTHRSHGARHNERLEFVGDAVLDCVVSEVLYQRFGDVDEGHLTRMRASLVNRETLAKVALRFELGKDVLVGDSERKSTAGVQASIVADALEAVFGAVFLDGGYAAARQVVERVYGDTLAQADPGVLGKDRKTRLQEWLQARRLAVPEYTVAEVTGEAPTQTFTAHCRIAALGVETAGQGPSRRTAEQAAAAAALTRLADEPVEQAGG